MRWIVLCVVVGVLGGCGLTPEGRARRAAREAAAEQALLDADTARCRYYGFQAGQADYGQCMLTLRQQRIQADIAQQQNGLMLMGLGAGALQPRQPTQTNCVAQGPFVNCRSY